MSTATAEEQDLAADPRWIGLAESIAKRYAAKFPPLADEFESAAPVALVEAARTFDPEKGASFGTHATTRIHGAMKDLHRHWTPAGFRRKRDEAPKIHSSDAPRMIGDTGDNKAMSLADEIAADILPIGWEIEYQDELARLSRGMTPKAGAVLRKFYGEAGSTMKQVGRSLDLSESRVSQLHEQAIKELKARFESPLQFGEFMSMPPLEETSEASKIETRRRQIEALNRKRVANGQEPYPLPELPAKAAPAVPPPSMEPKYRGITQQGNGKWLVRVTIDGKQQSFGVHEAKVEAARRYDKVLVEHKLYHLIPNFPDEMPAEWKAKQKEMASNGGPVIPQRIDPPARDVAVHDLPGPGRSPESLRREPVEGRSAGRLPEQPLRDGHHAGVRPGADPTGADEHGEGTGRRPQDGGGLGLNPVLSEVDGELELTRQVIRVVNQVDPKVAKRVLHWVLNRMEVRT